MGEQAKRELETGGGIGVRSERRGPIAIWTIDREDRMNALSRAVVRELGRLAREAAGDPSLRAVIVTGAGDRAFCAGADLKERQGMDEEDVRDFLPLYRASFGAIDRLPVPVIAAIGGVAFGGGLELALACDLRVAASHAKLGLTETSLGIIPGAGGTQRLTRVLGKARAMELMCEGTLIDFDRAAELGLVNHVWEREGFLDRAREYARSFCPPNKASMAVGSIKRAVSAGAEMSLEHGLSLERELQQRLFESADAAEGIRAYNEKRKPEFSGR